MGSSAKPGKFFFWGHWSTFCIKMPFGIGHPPPTHQMQSTCVQEGSRVPNLQTEFNYLDSFKSYGIFSDFVVPLVPTLSSSSPCHPHIVPLSSPSSPHHPHSPQKGAMWSPWLWSLWSPPHVVPIVPMVPTSSPSSPHHPCHPHIILVSSPSSPHHPHSPQKVAMWSPWLWSPWSPSHVVPVVPIVPMSSPHCLEGLHIIPNPLDTHSTYPHPRKGGGGKIWTNQDILILFEVLKSVETPPPMGGCMGSWVGGWVG